MLKRLAGTLFVFLFFVQMHAQQGLNQVSEALKSGNAGELAHWMHPTIHLTVLNREGTYSKAQAEQILQNFFSEHKALSFEVMHNGESGEQGRYVIGELRASDANFRVYLLYKTLSGLERIQTMRFEQNE